MDKGEATIPAGAAVNVDQLLQDLTAPQTQAVTHAEGPLLILAGAGTGKTRVVTRRAAYLSATVTQPRNILAITFTNKAANEMKQRVAALGVGREMTVCTFHSLCARILRIHHVAADLAPQFTIVDQADRRQLIKLAIQRSELRAENFRPAAIESRISRAKNAMQSPEDLAENAMGFFDKTVARLYAIYERLLQENNGVDFDDLLFKTARLVRDDEQVRDRLGRHYRYVLVDEYQDTNSAQYQIARLITRDHQNLCVTGDPDQSIYSWRGADISNILSFESDYPDATVIRLEQNYRSTKNILSAAGEVISGNLERKEKTLWTENETGAPVRVLACSDGNAEAQAVVGDMASLIADGKSPADFAVFYRINALSRTIEEALFRGGVGYRIARGTAFYARKEIKDILAYLRVMANPADSVSLERALNTPSRGIGKTTLARLHAFAEANACTLYDAVRAADQCDLTARAKNSLRTFAELLQTLQPLVQGPAQQALSTALAQSGLLAKLNQLEEADPEPLANVMELINAAADFDQTNPDGTLLDWLTFASLLGDEDVLQGKSGAVTLMTLHAAKGLEFPDVYIVGLEEGLLPLIRDHDGTDNLEEERRLFFVGMTRAQKRLTISHALWRTLHGQSTRTTRSSLLDELPFNEIQWEHAGNGAGDSRSLRHRDREPKDLAAFHVGVLVRHPRCGLGRIISMERGHKRTHARVEFESGDVQSWVLEFAELERVDYDDVG